MIPDDEDGDKVPAYKITADSEKLANLLKRQKTNAETAKMNNPVKNLYFLRDFGYAVFF